MQDLSGRTPALALAVSAVIFCAWAAAAAWRWPADILSAALHDHDTSYYLSVAWHIGKHGMASADGLNITSGFQLAWTALLSLLAVVAQDKSQLVLLTHALGVLLNLGSASLLFQTGRRLDPGPRGAAAGALLASAWLCWAMTRTSHLMGGMETALLTLGYLLLLRALLRVERAWKAGEQDLRGEIFCGAAAALIAFTRIDNALVCCLALTFFYLLHPQRPGLDARRLLVLALPLTALAASMAIYFQLAGEILPVSGVAKSIAAEDLPISVGLPLFAKAFAPIDALEHGRIALSLFYLAALAGVRWWLLPRWGGSGAFAVTAVAAAFVPYTALLGFWHRGLIALYVVGLYPVWLLALAMAGLALRPRAAAVALACAALAGCAAVTAVKHSHPAARDSLATERIHFSHDLSTQWPAHCRFASFVSAQLGFFMQQPMVNLDGLVNSGDYLRQVYSNPARLDAFLRSENVSYLVDYKFQWAEPLLPGYQKVDGAAWGLQRLQLYRTPWAEGDCPG